MDLNSSVDHLLWILGFPLLYAEIHYRIPGLFSRYFKKEPEILVDVPHRILSGQPVPVLLLVKDAHLYPITLTSVRVDVIHQGHRHALFEKSDMDSVISEPLWWLVHHIDLPAGMEGELQIDVRFCYLLRRKAKVCRNDNYNLTSRRPFSVFVDPEPWPREAKWYFGDLHFHSSYTEDQVEFGAPLQAAVAMARATELDFFAATDHSYDLDDCVNDYLQNDHRLPKWQRLLREIQAINTKVHGVLILPGEELSVGNARNENIHFLILNHPHFLPGSGDSAERWFRTTPELRVSDVLPLLDENTVAFAAHPEIEPPMLQKILIRRGKWEWSDYVIEGLTGLQIWNSEKDRFFEAGLKRWVELLLRGYRLFIIAGNDAHGNFGRFRQIKVPFWSMKENHQELFAKARTAVYLPEGLSLSAVIQSLRKGKMVLSDGPFAEFSLSDSSGLYRMGETFHGSSATATIRAKSSGAFGELKEVTLAIGDCDKKRETRSYTFRPASGSFTFFAEKFLADLPRMGYMRLAAFSERRGKMYRCLTNPIFLKRDESF